MNAYDRDGNLNRAERLDWNYILICFALIIIGILLGSV